MRFSTFQQDLNSWQGSTLIFGIVEEDLENQLKKIDFIIDSKLLLEKINQKKFKGEKGKVLNFDFFDQKLQTLNIIGLGESKNIDTNNIKNSLAEVIRKSTDKYMVQKSIDQEKDLYALLFKSYSSQFYSKGKIKVLTPSELETMVKNKKKFSIIIQNRHRNLVSDEVIEKLNPQIIRKKDGLYMIN